MNHGTLVVGSWTTICPLQGLTHFMRQSKEVQKKNKEGEREKKTPNFEALPATGHAETPLFQSFVNILPHHYLPSPTTKSLVARLHSAILQVDSCVW